MNRYFLPPAEWTGELVRLTGDEARHCAQVMRERIGSEIELFDGVGRSAVAKIETSSKCEVICQLGEPKFTTKPAREIVLVQSIPKGKNMDWIVQKAVELGVNRIHPVISRHSVVKVSSAEAEKKREKWQRAALEACKQCGQNWMVEIAPVEPLSAWSTHAEEFSFAMTGSLESDARPLRSLIQELPSSGVFAVAIGPEGDFSEEEYQSLAELSFQPVSFGPLVLKVETAALLALSALSLA